ncbi:MAG TPA: hypothetical protein G4N97_07910 [Thermoflexia bacterium]|nr:MAG: hypothetical protein DRI80_14815 [Chloroflexota bacterium]HEY68177.1 hypothetical protein [Thermoflexia bacterium]
MKRKQIARHTVTGDPAFSSAIARRQAIVALLLVLLPNLALTAVGLLLHRAAQQVAEAQAAGYFGLARFLRHVGLYAFLLLPMGVWLWWRRVGWAACGWEQEWLGGPWGWATAGGSNAVVADVSLRPGAADRSDSGECWRAYET